MTKPCSKCALLRIPAGVQWVLVVVNNNCTDDTDAVIARHSGDLPLRRLFEPNQGSSYGRNRAITASAGEVICFTDDDVLVDPEWLAEYVQAAKAWPQAGFFGGRIEPWFVKEPPPSIRRYIHVIGSAFALNEMADDVRPLGNRKTPTGRTWLSEPR